MGVRMLTRQGATVEVPDESVAELGARLRGSLVVPGDAGYDEARAVWNGMVDRRPAAIVRCAGAADVIAAVSFARQHDALISVRGGGHNVAGNAVCDDGLMIDLSAMRSVRVDPTRRTVRVEPGCLWSDVDAETQAFGLATPGGTVSQTGVAGLTLGGGIGHLMGLHGFTSDNLRSVDVVTATGEYLTASTSEHAELFWALRGAGANFGIATSFEFDVHPVGPLIFGGIALFTIDRAVEVLGFFRDFCRAAPDELAVVCGLIPSPDGDPLVALPLAWFGPIEDGDDVVAPIRALGPVVDQYGPLPYTAFQTLFDESVPAGIPRYWKSGFLAELTDEVIEIIVEHNAKKVLPISPVLLFHIHGAPTRRPLDETAFAHRIEEWDFDIVAQWTDPEMEAASIAWARDFWSAIEPHTAGVYVNHLDGEDAVNRVRSAYGANWERLVALKQKYDPDNVFRMNNNIPPT